MKRKLSSVLAAVMAATMIVSATPINVVAAPQNTKAVMQIASAQTTKDTVANTLLKDFKKKAKANKNGKQKSAQALANAMLKNKVIAFSGATMPVEEGLLNGFGNAEIKGFKKGVMFAPMIGSMPFIGYVFEVKSEKAGKTLIKNLKKNADLRWNVCTSADEMKAVCVGKRVIFVMSPKQFEE